MKSISANLTAGQKKLKVLPALDVRVSASRCGICTPEWVEVTTADTELQTAACCLADGSVVMAHVDAAANLQTCVVAPADRDTGAKWKVWTTRGSPAHPSVKPAVAADSSGNVYVIYRTNGAANTVRMVRSTDSGATWSGWSAVMTLTAGYTVTSLAAAIRPADGDMFLVYTYDPGGAGADDVLAFRLRDASVPSWGAENAWSDGAKYSFDGVDCFYSSDLYVVASGRDSTSPYLPTIWTLAYGDGGSYPAGSWWAKGELQSADDTNYSFYGVQICSADVARIGYVQGYAGTGGEYRVYTTAHLANHGTGDLYWTESAPFGFSPSATYSFAMAYDATNSYLYVITYASVWYAELTADHDSLESRVLEYEYRAGNRPGLWITLDNSDGALADAGESGSSFPLVKRGAEVVLYRGLAIGGTDYTSALPACYIESMAWVRRKGVDVLELACVDWEGLLGGWRATRLLQWSAETPAVIGGELCAVVGLDFGDTASEGSLEMSNLTPDFAILPGQAGDTALRRLMRLVPDVLRSDGAQGVYYKELYDSESVDYSVGAPGEHPILEGEFVDGSVSHNGVSVHGDSTVMGVDFDFNEIEKVGLRHRWIAEELYATGAEAAAQAEAEILREWAETKVGTLRVFPIHGLELWDVLQVTYARGWSGTRKYRVSRICEVLNRRKGLYEQRLGVVRIG